MTSGIDASCGLPYASVTAVQVELLLFCGRLNPTRGLPAAPSLTYITLTGVQPSWALAADLTADLAYVYFELDVVFSDPVATLLPDNIIVESGAPMLGPPRCDCMTDLIDSNPQFTRSDGPQWWTGHT